MATEATNVGIKNSWSLTAFARSHGKMKLANFTNKETGESFKSCAFVNPDTNETVCLVGFSSNLGPLTPAEIKAQQNDLQVVELESGTYKLCHRGGEAWEDIDLSL